MSSVDLSLTEYAVLGVLAEGPNHGFAVAKRLDIDTDVGRVFTVRRPLVYRALDRLVEAGYAEHVSTEKGGGPKRVIHQVTQPGRRHLKRWLVEPVEHVRDLRIEFLLKLALLKLSGRSPRSLIEKQRSALEPTLNALEECDPRDHVELWRRHSAIAAGLFLDEIGDL